MEKKHKSSLSMRHDSIPVYEQKKLWFFLPFPFFKMYLKISVALISNEEAHIWVSAVSQWEAIKHLVPSLWQLIHLKDFANVINLEWEG